MSICVSYDILYFKTTKTINYDACRMRRYRGNILQWEENNTDCMKRPTRDYLTMVFLLSCFKLQSLRNRFWPILLLSGQRHSRVHLRLHREARRGGRGPDGRRYKNWNNTPSITDLSNRWGRKFKFSCPLFYNTLPSLKVDNKKCLKFFRLLCKFSDGAMPLRSQILGSRHWSSGDIEVPTLLLN